MGRYIPSGLFNYIESKIKEFPNLKKDYFKICTSMVSYSSVSKSSNKIMGLIWIEFVRKHGDPVKVHLRKERNKTYPEELIRKFDSYRPQGWGQYPEFGVKNQEQAEAIVRLTKFAYENF